MLLFIFLLASCEAHSTSHFASHFASHSTHYNTKKIDGMWSNELQSQMYIEQLPNSPIINGYYNSSVGGTSGTYPLNGLITTQNLNQQIVAFCVTWQNLIADFMSITCWTGMFDYSSQTIESMWMLRRQSKSSWNTTLVGSDIFKRQ